MAAETSVKTLAGRFYLDGQPVSIGTVDGYISQIRRHDKVADAQLSDVFIAPGLIDNQVNGYGSVGFTAPGLTVEGVRTATRALQKEGVTSYLPTVITASPDRLLQNFAILARAVCEPDIALAVPGFHLEGPYISPEQGFRGAHNEKWIRPPNWQEFRAINAAAGGRILQVTVAPEIEGAVPFIRNCVEQGIVVALGHHNGSADAIRRAVDAGAVISTHLGNACANLIDRHENPLWPQLADDRLMASVIVDGLHLRPEEVRVFFKVKGPERVVLISDVTEFAGLPPGEYAWDDRKVVVTPEGKIVYAEQNVLAGASFPITKGIGNIMRFTGCSLADAIGMATRNPARLNGLHDRGEIQVGKRADLVLFTLKDAKLVIQKTIIGGRVVYEKLN